ncbi:hypothetical protein [Rhizobium tumorigenes]|uniref:hypothetical protein n=1 Tax=Rhizobium tumorigenes TaxID=2041385 RepID=UPI00241CBCFF|nr:hypothetical protein [Rhizobium tumorigenes]WFS01171.1 hypothetical protein PR016_00565 [Rhizobium tumorigenes]
MLGFSRVPDLQWSYGESSGSQPEAIKYYAGLRQCPNPECHTVISAFSDSEGGRSVHQPEVLVFSGSNLPPGLMGTIEEAVQCHAVGLYVASAVLVRHMLEHLCNDIGADGEGLQSRIAALNTFTPMTGERPGVAGGARIVFNDDAEIQTREPYTVSSEESELAIYLARQLLRAVYQYGSLRSRLMALRTAPGMG